MGGNHRVPYHTICDTWPKIPIILRYSNFAIIIIFLDNPLTKYHQFKYIFEYKIAIKKCWISVFIHGPN